MGAAESTQPSVQEEAYAFIGCLHRVRKMYKLRGFNADFTKKMFSPYILNKLSRRDGDIREAANLWDSDPAAAEKKYGHISEWDVSCVTTMNRWRTCMKRERERNRIGRKNSYGSASPYKCKRIKKQRQNSAPSTTTSKTNQTHAHIDQVKHYCSGSSALMVMTLAPPSRSLSASVSSTSRFSCSNFGSS